MFTNISRIIKFAFQDFSRNKGVSIAAIFVLIVTILLVTGLFFFQGIASYLTLEIQNKIDITAYFKEGTPEQDILEAKDEILNISTDIKNIEYVSPDQAFEAFSEKHMGDEVLARALEQVGSNPFLPSLNITTTGDPLQYEQVANTLQTSGFAELIEKVDFSEKKDTIEKVYSITTNINKYGIIIGIILILVAMLVVFNTIKLAVDSSKEEIATMRIVGASDWFIRGPFIIQGIIYGFIAFIFCILISGVFAYILSPKLAVIMPGFGMFDYFLTNFWILVLIQLGFGTAVGIFSSLVVVRKYLQV
jgi:cell division transport system permease protein